MNELSQLGALAGKSSRRDDYLARNLTEISRFIEEATQLEAARARDYDGLEAQLRAAPHEIPIGRRLVQRTLTVDGQFLMSTSGWGRTGAARSDYRLGFRDVQNATNQRTLIAAVVPGAPCGNNVPVLTLPTLQAQLELPFLNGFLPGGSPFR